MAARNRMEEVGDLFVTETSVTLKLLPSKKEGSRQISWFSDGCVTNVRSAAKDIATLAGKLTGRRRIVRGVTVVTDGGTMRDLEGTGLTEAIEKAGLSVIR